MASPLEGAIRKTVGKAFYKLFLAATVTRDVPGVSTDAWNPVAPTPTPYTCRAIFETYGPTLRAAGMVGATDMQALILADTLSIEPQPGDRITIDGKTLTIVPVDSQGEPAVKTDPAKATWACRARA